MTLGALGILVVPGTTRAVAVARQWALLILEAEGWKRTDDAVLAVSELTANAVRHTYSGTSGGRVTIALLGMAGDQVRIDVIDEGGPLVPRIMEETSDALSGRGLRLVAELSTAWGSNALAAGRCVWALLPMDYGQRGH
ncbi:ATP-binding protein [Spongiactinospora sp. 9N601]|uniref:ATP-binding protein n=1 Tax=Spongiactinospora sp. 9N601 TaxID=3375149 RepID=UPI0037B68976